MFKCKNCKKEFNANEIIVYHNEEECSYNNYCKECFEKMPRCKDCGEIIEGEKYFTWDNKILCRICKENYLFCEQCHCRVEEENLSYYDEYDEDGDMNEYEVCPKCFFEVKHMHSHEYKPNPIFKCVSGIDNRSLNLHVGIELEINAIGKNGLEHFLNEFNNSNNNDFYMKQDGSLTSRGVEIVSHPMTLDYLYNAWEGMFEAMKRYSMKDISDCGLHIHVDREYLDERAIKNLDYILNNYTEYFMKVAGRNYSCNQWCSTISKDNWGETNPSRYVAVNLRNKNTVEIRICKSTSDFEQFMYRVINILALVNYCKKHTFDFVANKTDEQRFCRMFMKFYKKFASEFYNKAKN